jgi:hypothetical protein
MTISFSPQLGQRRGYRKFFETEPIVASFHSLNIYAVQGIKLDEATVVRISGSLSGTAYAFAVGNSVNALTQELLGDDLAEDEVAWAEVHRCTPPYAVIHIGPTSPRTCVHGHVKEEDGSITTLDSFAEATTELRSLEDRALPLLVTSLYSAFSLENHPVRLRRVRREAFGITPDGVVVHDEDFPFKMSLVASRMVSAGELRAGVERVEALATSIKPEVARFFHLAIEEGDLLKRFLYFFLSIEIETHKTFQSVDHSAYIARLLKHEDRIPSTMTSFLEVQQRERWTNLQDRFVWCAYCVWTAITDADVSEFKRIKKIRDKIAHGTMAVPPAESVRVAEELASKLQRLRANKASDSSN